mmetsp:Transcript_22101/g.67899  ORF Transcript_22101/g.67899 Transcript_22101/m.67899 type:complete len:356 (+) Transcript_22101:413-1480(+)
MHDEVARASSHSLEPVSKELRFRKLLERVAEGAVTQARRPLDVGVIDTPRTANSVSDEAVGLVKVAAVRGEDGLLRRLLHVAAVLNNHLALLVVVRVVIPQRRPLHLVEHARAFGVALGFAFVPRARALRRRLHRRGVGAGAKAELVEHVLAAALRVLHAVELAPQRPVAEVEAQELRLHVRDEVPAHAHRVDVERRRAAQGVVRELLARADDAAEVLLVVKVATGGGAAQHLPRLQEVREGLGPQVALAHLVEVALAAAHDVGPRLLPRLERGLRLAELRRRSLLEAVVHRGERVLAGALRRAAHGVGVLARRAVGLELCRRRRGVLRGNHLRDAERRGVRRHLADGRHPAGEV